MISLFVDQFPERSIVILEFLFALMLLSLGSKRISVLMLALAFLGPIIISPIIMLSAYIQIESAWLFLMFVFILIVLWYFSVEFPISEDFNNREFINQVNLSNEVLELIKNKEEKSEWDEHWIGDGIPINVPKKITKAEEIINRLIYFYEYKIKQNLRLVKNYFEWSYGRGGDLDCYSQIYKNPSAFGLQYKKSEELCEDIKILIRNMDSNVGFKPSFLVSMGLYYLIADEVSFYFGGWNWSYFAWSTGVLILLGIIFQRVLRRYVGGKNASYRLFSKYQEKLTSRGEVVGVSVREANGSDCDYWGQIIVKAIKYSEKDIREGLVQEVDNVQYLVIEPGMSYKSLLVIFNIIKNEKKFLGWLKFFCEKNGGRDTDK